MTLIRDGQQFLLFDGVLKRNARTIRDSVVVRQTNAELSADLRAFLAEAFVILTIQAHHESVAIDEELDRIFRNHRRRK